MAFSSIFKKATSLLGFGGNNLKPPPLDGEIIYCKNNVCVHPPASLTSEKEEHHQGYLTLRSHCDKVCMTVKLKALDKVLSFGQKGFFFFFTPQPLYNTIVGVQGINGVS